MTSGEPNEGGSRRAWSRVRARVVPLLLVSIVVLLIVIAALASGRSGGETRALVGATSPGTVSSESVKTTDQMTVTTAALPQGISWQNALVHEGESVTILGTVVSAVYAKSSNGSPTFLNIGVDYPDEDRLTVVIWGDDRYRFPTPPEEMYRGRNVAVSGMVKEYKGVAEIIVSNPDQTEIY